MRSDLETTFSPDWAPIFDRRDARYIGMSRLPENDLQALMEAKPHQQPETSLHSTEHLRDVIADAIDQLDDRTKWIFEAHVFRCLSFKQIAEELSLSKSFVHRVFVAARERLAEELGGTLRPDPMQNG